ncbi:hypothetical protein D3C85_1490390 [compost metagenome]
MDTPEMAVTPGNKKEDLPPLARAARQFLSLQGIQTSDAQARSVAKTLARLIPPSQAPEDAR